MNIGAEPKKVAILGLLLVVASYLIYSNLAGGDTETTAASTGRPAGAAAATGQAAAAAQTAGAAPSAAAQNAAASLAAANASAASNSAARRRAGAPEGMEEFRPSLKPREGKERVDTAKIDPTLELYRLQRLQQISAAPGGRNLFEFGAVPPPPQPDVKILPKVAEVKPLPQPPLVEPPPQQPPQIVKPQAPPIPLKYYGFSQKDYKVATQNGGPSRGLFLRGGEEIFVAAEGDLIDRRYKVVRVQAGSATLLDVQFDHEQSIPIERVPE
jgi:hypothetical protein